MRKLLPVLSVVLVVLGLSLLFVVPKLHSLYPPPHTTITSLPPQAREYNDRIAAMIGEIDTAEIAGSTLALQNFSTRRFGTPGNEQAADYLHDRLAAIPGLIVGYQGGRFRNVIATLPGRNASSDLTFIVGAHYDSIADGEYAPGATDNGCGTAIVLELARVMSRHQYDHTIMFALWNSEELDPMGSEVFVEEAARDLRNIPLYYNYDAACIDPENRLVLDIQSGNESAAAAELARHNNALYGIGFNLTSNQFDCVSDYLVFDHYGYPGIATHSASHGQGHTGDDTIDTISPDFARKNAQLGASVLAGLAGIRT